MKCNVIPCHEEAVTSVSWEEMATGIRSSYVLCVFHTQVLGWSEQKYLSRGYI
jgi:hypothetical protein